MQPTTPTNGPKRPPRGTYAVKVDATGRFKLPAAYKEYLDSLPDNTLFITLTFGMIRAYTGSSWEQALSKLETRPLVQLAVWEDGDRYGQDVKPDSTGRATLPQKVREAAPVEDAMVQMRFHGEVIWMYTDAQYAAMTAKNDATRDDVKSQAAELGFV
jgi:DNA-binding transcriptional regulator/RsmH inhibitor MraZ